jgi:polyphosphate kinase
VETLVPVEGDALTGELSDTIERCLADDTFAWELEGGAWTRREGNTRNAQAELMERATKRAEPVEEPVEALRTKD